MESVHWGDIKGLVKQVNPSLCKIIEAINPGTDLPLFLVNYYYGDYIAQQGEIRFPQGKGKFVDLASLSAATQKLLNRNKIPLGLLLNKTAEYFSSYDDNIVSLNILKAGQLIGLCELFPPKCSNLRCLNIAAGVRTAFLLPNVSDSTHHRKLINIYQAPQKIDAVLDHWYTFKKIANYRFHHRRWCCEFLFFSNAWLEKLDQADTLPWLQLKSYLLEQAWRQTPNLFQYYNNMYLKHAMLKAMAACQVNLSDYAIGVIKYIFLMQQGCVPGFQMSDGSEAYLPESVIQEAYIQDYKLKTYLPVIMHSVMWEGANKQAPLYYSLNFPLSFSGVGVNTKGLRITELLQRIRCVIRELGLTERCRYRYMHHQAQVPQKIEKASDVLKNDPRIIKLQTKYPNREVSSSNTFVRGCIQLENIE